ncbi:Negative regulator of genetic competence ClpC/MecB [Amycolatopsis sp. M39]|nr:Negative regulator of genetic competence ClpC/MecB [Amycolatopsis sp. M39]
MREKRSPGTQPDRPSGSFLFLGPTGVGKTELAQALAGDQDSMVRIDLSEYSERHAVSRLIGSLPGYVGADRQLTEPVRRRPHSVVLLDEVEKAHPDLFTVLLQVLDDGRGRTSGFASTVPIMIGNLSSDLAGSSTHGAFGFVQPADELRERLMRRLRASFRPELLNRIDEIVVFRPLEADQLDWITGLLPVRAKRGSHAQGRTVEFTPVRISELGFGPQFGARPAAAGDPATGLRPRRRSAARPHSARSPLRGRRGIRRPAAHRDRFAHPLHSPRPRRARVLRRARDRHSRLPRSRTPPSRPVRCR